MFVVIFSRGSQILYIAIYRIFSQAAQQLGSPVVSLLAGRCQAETGRNGLRPLLVKSRFMRTERTQNSHWSKVPHELISCKYLTRTIYRRNLTASVLIICSLSGRLFKTRLLRRKALGCQRSIREKC
jgi:hypothetical protein